MILPAFGIISEIIPTFARKRCLATRRWCTQLLLLRCCRLWWAHHMFTVGMPLVGEVFFMFATMLIAVPTGVKVFNWTATMFRGSMTFETPMLLQSRSWFCSPSAASQD